MNTLNFPEHRDQQQLRKVCLVNWLYRESKPEPARQTPVVQIAESPKSSIIHTIIIIAYKRLVSVLFRVVSVLILSLKETREATGMSERSPGDLCEVSQCQSLI